MKNKINVGPQKTWEMHVLKRTSSTQHFSKIPTSEINNKYKASKNKLTCIMRFCEKCITLNLLKILSHLSKIHGMFYEISLGIMDMAIT